MITVTNTAIVGVQIAADKWTYTAIDMGGAVLASAGTVIVPKGSGTWSVTYVLESSQYQLFSALVNTNTAQIGTLTDFDQIMGLDFVAGTESGVKKIGDDGREVTVYTSTATVYFANTAVSEGGPAGISFELWARTTDGLHVLISRDPQVKNEN